MVLKKKIKKRINNVLRFFNLSNKEKMGISLSYEEEFVKLFKNLLSHYPEEIQEIEGIGNDLDINQFAENFFKSNITTDATIDDNANVTDNSVISYRIESKKPIAKLNSFYMLWKELKNQFGLEEANKIIERQYRGDIYINDFHGIGGALPYCFNYSTYDIMLKGLPMVKKIKSKPPKHLYSFKSQVEQFTVIASNSTLGATLSGSLV